jgi:hypothetical protein
MSGTHPSDSYAYMTYDRDPAQLKSLAHRQHDQHDQYPSYSSGPPPPRHHAAVSTTTVATDISYAAHGAPGRQQLVGGTLGGPSDHSRPAHVSQAYHSSLSYRDHPPSHTHLHPGSSSSAAMYSSSDDSRLGPYPSRHYNPAHSDASHSSMSRSPPAEHDALPVTREGEQPPHKPPTKRREKPRIELAPDQPLTTQGKPRARVFVACVQWFVSVRSSHLMMTVLTAYLACSRTRKIRCDGAKPVCHNCSRRVVNGGSSEDLATCTYDTAPKRRGPDKIPGSRQRVASHDPAASTDGGKVRRRRRRDPPAYAMGLVGEPVPGPSDGGAGVGVERSLLPMEMAARDSALALSGDGLGPEPKVSQHAAAAPQGLSAYTLDSLAHAQPQHGHTHVQGPGHSPSHGVRGSVGDVYRAGGVHDLSPTSAVGQVSSLRGINHPSNSLQRIVTVSEPQYSHGQVRVAPLSLRCPSQPGVPARPGLTLTQIAPQISPPQQQAYASGSSVGATSLPYTGYVSPTSVRSHGSGEYEYDDEEHTSAGGIGAEPSMQLTRDTWWDALLGLYSTHTQSPLPGGASPVLTPGLRESLAHQITSDLKFLFRASNYWFACFNVPRFFTRLCDPIKRTSLQPSLILAALAVANFIRSSDQEHGAAGRNWALTLLEQAQSSLESSINARWVDEGLVQASWVSICGFPTVLRVNDLDVRIR